MGFKKGLEKTAIPAALILGAVAVGAKKVIGSASDLNEAMSAVNVTFGDSADQVQHWSKSTDDAFSRVEFLSAAKTFAGFGKAADLTGDQLNDFSKDLIDAAGDMASFHNVPVAQVLDDLRSGLTGEVEPLRKYNILLNEAALNETAYAEGIAKRGHELTDQQKVLARQAFILQNLGAANNDYARTADGAANTERRLAANQEDTAASIGEGLMPAYQALLGVLEAVTGVMAEHTTAVTVGTLAITGLAAALLTANAALKVYNSQLLAGARARAIMLGIARFAGPVGLVAVGVLALGQGLKALGIQAKDAAGTFESVADAARDMDAALDNVQNTTKDLRRANLDNQAAILAVKAAHQTYTQTLKEEGKNALATKEAHNAYRQAQERQIDTQIRVNEATVRHNQSLVAQRKSIQEAKGQTAALTKGLDDARRRMIAATEVAGDYGSETEKNIARQEAMKATVDEAKDSLRNQIEAFHGNTTAAGQAAQRVLDYINQTNEIPDKKTTDILLHNMDHSLDQVEQLRLGISRIKTVNIIDFFIRTHGSAPGTTPTGIPRATGGPVSRARSYLVGERGPELFVPSSSGSIVPNHALGAPGRGTVAILEGDRQFVAWFRSMMGDYSLANGGREAI